MTSSEPGLIFVALVAFGAGLIRGFTGFGGPAFMLAILTLFFSPIAVVSKVLVVDFFASVYMFKACFRDINWRDTACMVIPTLLFMPLGHWLLVELDPLIMKRAMAVIIAAACLAMLLGYRYRRVMTPAWLVLVGVISGIVFGGSYIALVSVVAILLGPYDKNAGRTLIVSWSSIAILGFALMSAFSGTTDLLDVWVALPGAATYLLGTWLGSRGFQKSSEKIFRRATISMLLLLSLANLVI